jgi:hypothetical protein
MKEKEKRRNFFKVLSFYFVFTIQNQYTIGTGESYWPCLASNTKNFNFIFTFFKNSQHQNIPTFFLYYSRIFIFEAYMIYTQAPGA